MTEKRKPWMKFYPADWQADEGLRQCSLTSRGLWIEMIAVMHKSSVYGHLLIAGFTPTEAQIAAQVSSDAKTVKACIAELESWGVFSRTPEGIIYSRRMLEDARKEKANRENGSGGGNPALRLVPKGEDNEGVNPQDNQRRADADNRGDNRSVNRGDKAQRLEAIYPEEESKPLASLTPSKPPAADADFEAWWKNYPRKVGKDAARKAFASALKRGASAGELTRAIAAQSWNPDPQFIPHASTWLNEGRWQDEPTAAAPASLPPQPVFRNGFFALRARAQRQAGADQSTSNAPDLLEITHGNC